MRGGAGAELGPGMRDSGCGDGDAGLGLGMRDSGCEARDAGLGRTRSLRCAVPAGDGLREF